MSENANLSFEKINEEKKSVFFQSETFKTMLTVLVILLIPVAAFAWNFFTGKDGLNQLKQAFNVTDNNNSNGGSNANEDDTDNDKTGTTQPNNVKNGSKLPATSARFKYVVKKGDTINTISLKECDNNYFANTTSLKDVDLVPGKVISIKCN